VVPRALPDARSLCRFARTWSRGLSRLPLAPLGPVGRASGVGCHPRRGCGPRLKPAGLSPSALGIGTQVALLLDAAGLTPARFRPSSLRHLRCCLRRWGCGLRCCCCSSGPLPRQSLIRPAGPGFRLLEDRQSRLVSPVGGGLCLDLTPIGRKLEPSKSTAKREGASAFRLKDRAARGAADQAVASVSAGGTARQSAPRQPSHAARRSATAGRTERHNSGGQGRTNRHWSQT